MARGDYDPRRLPAPVEDLLVQFAWAVAYVVKVSRPDQFRLLADGLEALTPVQAQAFTQRLSDKVREAFSAEGPT